MKSLFGISIIFVCLLTGCASLKPASFQSEQPVLDPVKFFGGKTHSAGVLENKNGKPSQRITTKTSGHFVNGILTIDQDLYPEGQKVNHRTFTLKQVDAHHVEATADDIEGTATGELYGNYFTWTFRRKVNTGLVKHVKMTQYFYLMPGGNTMIVRSVIRKFGIIVKEISEEFIKE